MVRLLHAGRLPPRQRRQRGKELQQVTLSNGEIVTARLIVLANGLNVGLRHHLGIERVVTSPCHSLTLGFDLRRRDGQPFPFGSLTYDGENTAAQMAYLTLFPIQSTMRANLMVYRTMDDPWLREMRCISGFLAM